MKLLRSQTGRLLVEAHRTAEALAPPNSWAGLMAAAEAGADLIELDVQLSADEVAVLHHDYRLHSGAFVRATPAPMLDVLDAGDGRPPPRLEAVLAWLHSQPPERALTLDVKNGFGQGVLPFARTVEAVARAGLAERVVLSGWDHMGLLWAKRHLPRLTTQGQLRANPLDLVAIVKRAELDAVALGYDLIDAADVEALHEVGVAVMLVGMWEPNFRYAVQLGVDGVSWGDPAEARFALAQMQAGR